MMLNVTAAGPQTTALPPVVVAHGLFGQGRNLGVIARALSDSRRVLSVDMRNHGESFWDDDHSYDALAGDLARVIHDAGAPADVVGHSMGGKAAMWLALTRPESVRRLVVLDIAPVAYGHSQSGIVKAVQGTDLTGVATRSAADAALAGRVADPGTRAFLLQSLDLRADPPRWRMNLAALEANMDRLVGWPGGGATFDGPALFLHGSDSDYVTAEGEQAIRSHFPQAGIVTIPGTGHWLHADRPAEIAERVAAFLG